MNILAIGAHPDDIEYGCGGTLVKYAMKNHNIFLLIMTDGSESGDVETRRKEQEEAAKFLTAKKVIWGGYKDTKLILRKEMISLVEDTISEIKPDEIYVNYYDDTHQDHRILTECVISASRYSKKVLFYEDFTSRNYQPDIFVDIAEVLDEKIELLKKHSSQVNKTNPTNWDLVESVKALANFRGFQGKVKYAEGFKAYRYLKRI